MNTNTNILVIGEHNVGKTIYGVQLLGRLRANAYNGLRMNGMPDTISPFDSGLAALNQGQTPSHTPIKANLEVELPILFNECQVTLTWPDYGGEQINEIFDSRSLSEIWQNQITKADAWMLFLRLNTLDDSLDVISHPVPESKNDAIKKSTRYDTTEIVKHWNSNAKIIELVQIFLDKKNIGIQNRVKVPVLVVVLSCWDELETKENDLPFLKLKHYLPLLYEFLTTVWDADSLAFFGLSSLGMSVESNTVNEVFRNQGPEQHGYVVKPDGSKSADLSEPIRWLMERTL
jgi:GTPase SAR1 family protein